MTKKFLDFLLLMGVDIDKTEENDLNEYYVAYKSTLDGLMKNINIIYDNLLNIPFKQEEDESSEEKLDDILSIDLNNMDEIELKKLLDKTTNSPILSKYPDKGDLYKKLQVFFKKNNMKLYELHIEADDKSQQYVKETWVHKKSGYSMITAYPISYETFNLLDSSMKKT